MGAVWTPALFLASAHATSSRSPAPWLSLARHWGRSLLSWPTSPLRRSSRAQHYCRFCRWSYLRRGAHRERRSPPRPAWRATGVDRSPLTGAHRVGGRVVVGDWIEPDRPRQRVAARQGDHLTVLAKDPDHERRGISDERTEVLRDPFELVTGQACIMR